MLKIWWRGILWRGESVSIEEKNYREECEWEFFLAARAPGSRRGWWSKILAFTIDTLKWEMALWWRRRANQITDLAAIQAGIGKWEMPSIDATPASGRWRRLIVGAFSSTKLRFIAINRKELLRSGSMLPICVARCVSMRPNSPLSACHHCIEKNVWWHHDADTHWTSHFDWAQQQRWQGILQ